MTKNIPTQENSPPHNPIFSRLYDPLTELPERFLFEKYRHQLATELMGTVLEIGIGTGRMIRFYSQYDTGQCDFYGLDPDRDMLRQAARKSSHSEVPVSLTRGVVESLPYPPNSMNTVISTFVLCSVYDQHRAIKEIHRVLRPDGEFRFIEHIHAPGIRGILQSNLTPLWRRLAGGCNLDRDTLGMIRRSGYFEELSVETLGIGITPIRPIVHGTYRARDS